MTTQNYKILNYLRRGGRINPLKALNLFDCFRLAARIADIKAWGEEIASEMVKNNKTGKRYKEYWLV